MPGRRVGGIIPAYAGSTPSPPRRRPYRRDHPRIRGEHASGIVQTRRRGWIIPAYAGSTPLFLRSTPAVCGSSPHTRGAQLAALPEWRGWRIIPAYAGSTVWASLPMERAADHPRIRGEHSRHSAIVGTVVGSSPHTRGAQVRYPWPGCRRRIIPAYAGSTRPDRHPRRPRRDHPRIRGEHERAGRSPRRRWGSSPHTRGAPLSPTRHTIIMGIIPAYAGSTRPEGSLMWIA